MNRYRILIACGVAVIVGLAGTASAQSAQGHRECSNNTMSGAWGYTETGTVIAPVPTGGTTLVPVAVVGRYEFDRAGSFEGFQYGPPPAGGTGGRDTKEGTYEISGDCTGTFMLTAYRDGVPQRSSVWWFVIVDRGQEMRGILTSMKLPDGTPVPFSPVITMTARKVYSGPIFF
jgi:hypothetical protein